MSANSKTGGGFGVVGGIETEGDRMLVASLPFAAMVHDHSDQTGPAMLRKAIELLKAVREQSSVPDQVSQALGWLLDAEGVFDRIRSRALDLFVAEYARAARHAEGCGMQVQRAVQAKFEQSIDPEQPRVDWVTAIEEFEQATANLETAYRECLLAHQSLLHLEPMKEEIA